MTPSSDRTFKPKVTQTGHETLARYRTECRPYRMPTILISTPSIAGIDSCVVVSESLAASVAHRSFDVVG